MYIALFVIYLIGVLFVYNKVREQNRELSLDNYNWGDVVINMFISFTSWIFLLVIILTAHSRKISSKPPKWL